VGFVIRGGARKLTNLRARPRVTVVFRSGWEWVAVEGDVDLAGPDDPLDGVEPEQVLQLLREVYAAAVGGTADDWAGMDAEMEAERHTAALVRRARISSNPG
ncbi:MAG TPA: pyridoxamine 5'-phosphate oxidase, partial [Acidimicrobiia bacterium]|nr:pyridoxamine 5'-phosphate oxidase [Acidimicrobiia bacterium]